MASTTQIRATTNTSLRRRQPPSARITSSSRSWPQNRCLPSTIHVGTPNTPASFAAVVSATSAALTVGLRACARSIRAASPASPTSAAQRRLVLEVALPRPTSRGPARSRGAARVGASSRGEDAQALRGDRALRKLRRHRERHAPPARPARHLERDVAQLRRRHREHRHVGLPDVAKQAAEQDRMQPRRHARELRRAPAAASARDTRTGSTRRSRRRASRRAEACSAVARAGAARQAVARHRDPSRRARPSTHGDRSWPHTSSAAGRGASTHAGAPKMPSAIASSVRARSSSLTSVSAPASAAAMSASATRAARARPRSPHPA